MSVTTRYFRYSFAQEGDVEQIPMLADPDGEVSFQQGYTPPYGIPFDDPAAVATERDQWNSLLMDITQNIKQYQENGVPNFVAAADNAGVAVAYEKNSIVRYNGINYISLVDGNTTVPPSANWETALLAVKATENLVENSNFQIWGHGDSFSATNQQIEFADTWYATSTDTGGGTINITKSEVQMNAIVLGSPTYTYADTGSDFASFINIAAGLINTGASIGNRIKRASTFNNKTITMSLLLFLPAAITTSITVIPSFIQNFGTSGSPSSPVTTTFSTVTIPAPGSPGDRFVTISVTGLVPSVNGKTFSTAPEDFIQTDFKFVNGTTNLIFSAFAGWIDIGEVPSYYEGRSKGFEAANSGALQSQVGNSDAGASLIGYYGGASSYGNMTVQQIIDILWNVGDYKFTSNTTQPGWVLYTLNATIGNAASLATYANANTQRLFEHYWNTYNDTECPVLPGGRGASASADYAANKTIALPNLDGQTLIVAGTAYPFKTQVGSATHTLTIAEMPAHDHPGSTASGSPNDSGNGHVEGQNDTGDEYPINVASQGGGDAFNIMQPSNAQYLFIKL